MIDNLTKKHRSWNMGQIKSQDTKPEIIVRKILHKAGYRFRLHKRELPGKPDIVLPKYKTVIFVHGCFWHRHKNCSDATIPKTRTDFWLKKLNKNVERDKKVKKELYLLGWYVITIWECQISKQEKLLSRIKEFLNKV